MTKRESRDRVSASAHDARFAYSPRLRTALVLLGSGTAGAYHAGVLRAVEEAGVKVDLVAGRGIGAPAAMFAAIDGSSRLWETAGLWRRAGVRDFYSWRPALKIALAALIAALAIFVVPLALFALGLVVFLLGFLFRVAGLAAGSALAGSYTRAIERAFEPDMLPTFLPRVTVLCLSLAAAAMASGAFLARAPRRERRYERGWIWDVLGAPWSVAPVAARFRSGLWRLIQGGTAVREPEAGALSRRYCELLGDNLGQPGFRELLVTAHDLDARRDLLFALLSEPHRGGFFRQGSGEPDRRSEAFDLAGVGRDFAVDALEGSLRLAVLTEPHLMTFATESFWRGETHRLCDRPGASCRLVQETAAAGVEQVIVVAPGVPLTGPHGLTTRRSDIRARVGDGVGASDIAASRDAVDECRRLFESVFVIAPAHTAVGPFDFGGAYDERSARHQAMTELIDRGYEDAYRQFIDPVVGASGDRLDLAAEPRTARQL